MLSIATMITETRIEAFGPGLGCRLHWALVRWAYVLIRRTVRRGFGLTVRMLGRVFPGAGQWVVAGLASGGRLRIPLDDTYWLAWAASGGVYEPDLDPVLRRLLARAGRFLDCGANIGYWSVVARHSMPPGAEVIAVEPGFETFERLRDNVALNGGAVRCVQAAVWSEDLDAIAFSYRPRDHSGASVTATRTDPAAVDHPQSVVPAVTIDTLLSAAAPGLTVVKLDVEGAEIEALRGASATLRTDFVLLYEDHGRNPESRVTSFVQQLGLATYFLDPESGALVEIGDVSALRERKRDPSRGYNLLACRPGFALPAA